MSQDDYPQYDYRNINDVIHSRVRLAIMSYLMTAGSSDFTGLKKALKVSDGNLSVHIKKLEDAGYLSAHKQFKDNKPLTTVSLTEGGREAFQSYLDDLSAMIGQS